jgi:DNA-binding PadR family transcriptional regulator
MLEPILLGVLYRRPMHGYEIILELALRRVGWWARVEKSHVYMTLRRLEKAGLIAGRREIVEGRARKVLRLTPAGREAARDLSRAAAEQIEPSFFDLDVFLANLYLLDKNEALRALEIRIARVFERLEEARRIRREMSDGVPVGGKLIIDHRIGHLKAELDLAREAKREIEARAQIEPLLGSEPVEAFLSRSGERLDTEGLTVGGPKKAPPKRR